MKHKKTLLALLFTIFHLNTPVHAEEISGDLALEEGSIRSKDDILAEKTVRIYATVKNNSDQDLLGTVKFYDETKGEFIGLDQPVSVIAQGTDDVFVDWNPGQAGSKKITARILPWTEEGDNPSNNKISATLYADIDSDEDKIPNQKDPDDDNDGVNDTEDTFPLDPGETKDTDRDGTGNNADDDDDGDGVADIEDLFPTDSGETSDKDGDGVGDNNDKFPDDPNEAIDEDNDGIGANSDTDDQNKGPKPVIKANVVKLAVGKVVELDARESSDEDGSIVSYQWDFGDNTKAEGERADKSFDQPGEYNVSLTVTDDKGESRTQSLNISIVSQWERHLIMVTGLVFFIAFFVFFGLRKRKIKNPLSENIK